MAGGASGLWHCLSFQTFPPLRPSQVVPLLSLKAGGYRNQTLRLLRLINLKQYFGMSSMTNTLFLTMFCDTESSIFTRGNMVPFSEELSNFGETLVQKLFLCVRRYGKLENFMLVKYICRHILSEVGHILAACETPEQQLQVAGNHTSQAHLKAFLSKLSVCY